MPTERIHRPSNRTDEERARERAVREKFQRERPSLESLVEFGDSPPPIPFGLYLELRAAMSELKRQREKAGLSLAELAERTGMDKGALSRLENGVQDNPTIVTLLRYAAALGKKLTWSIQDLPAATT